MENKLMSSWRFRLKDLAHLAKNPDKTKTQIMRDSLLSWPTVLKFTNAPQDITDDYIPSFIIGGLDVSPEELAEMKIGDVFQIEKVK